MKHSICICNSHKTIDTFFQKSRDLKIYARFKNAEIGALEHLKNNRKKRYKKIQYPRFYRI